MSQDLRYDGQLMSDDPQVFFRVSASWLNYLLGVAVLLAERETWHQADDVETALAEVDRLLGELVAGREETVATFYTSPIFWGVKELKTPNGLNGIFTSSNYLYYGGIYNITPADNQKLFAARVYLSQGTYRIKFVGARGSNHAQTRFKATGPATVYTAYVDHYSASTTYNAEWEVILDIGVPGDYLLEWFTFGKNPLSTNYTVAVSTLSLARLA